MATEKRNHIKTTWNWLRDAENRKVIAWIGSGLVALLGVLLYQNIESTPAPTAASQSATANKGMATVGDVNVDGDVVINGGPEESAESPQK